MQIATLEDGAVGFRGISTPRTGGCIEFAFIEVGEIKVAFCIHYCFDKVFLLKIGGSDGKRCMRDIGVPDRPVPKSSIQGKG